MNFMYINLTNSNINFSFINVRYFLCLVSKFPDNCDRWPQPYSFGKSLKKESNGCSENDMDETLVQKASGNVHNVLLN